MTPESGDAAAALVGIIAVLRVVWEFNIFFSIDKNQE